MLTRIPDRVKVGWKNYDVVFSESRLNSGPELYGQIDYNACTITLRESASPDQQRATLIHEMLHAVSDMYGLGLEEKLVEDLTNALYTVYKDNIELQERKYSASLPMNAEDK